MSKAFVTVAHFPITPINTSYRQQLCSKLNRKILTPRLRDDEDLRLGYTTEHATQFDVVCFKFETLEDAAQVKCQSLASIQL